MGELLLVFFEEGQYILHGNHRSVNTDALAKINEMRRGEESSLIAKFLEIRGKERRYGAFAVGAGHVHAAQVPLRVADNVQEGFDVFEAFLVCRAPDLVVHRVGGEDAV